MQSLVILGRQPAISLAELESLFGSDAITPLSGGAALVDFDLQKYDTAQLGGTQKIAEHLDTLPYSDWKRIRSHLKTSLPSYLNSLPEGKVKLGLSTYGFDVKLQELNATGLELKKVMKREGKSARIIANKTHELNTAQVIHGGLLTDVGMELVIVRDGNKTYIGQTVHVQDIDAYAARDRGRPARDSFVGMLPPKLAQTIINLAIGNQELGNSTAPISILDPFCGTGVILQESLLMGFSAIGSDLEPRMVEFSNTNLNWLENQAGKLPSWDVSNGDATSRTWNPMPDTIACETYLGRPLSSTPDSQTLQKIMNDCHMIHKKFLQNVARQTQKGFKMCIAVPAWRINNGFRHLKTLDSLEELGYTRMSFVHVKDADLIYHRADQIVARELVVLTRK